jgi:acetyl esterase/lipase
VYLIMMLTARSGIADEQPTGHSARDDHSVGIVKGLQYSDADDGLKLDLYLPVLADSDQEPGLVPGVPGLVPCVIVIQGGGFRAQDGQRFRPFAQYLAERGFAAALIGYRGTPRHRYMDTVADMKAAVRYVRDAGPRYKIDPERIGAMGRSAGGTLAALLAVTGDVKELEGTGGHEQQSARIKAAVAYAGVFDFVSRFTDERQLLMQPNHRRKLVSNGEWIGSPLGKEDSDWLKASAVSHVDALDAPMLLIHCKDDSTVPWLQSQQMADRLKAAGVDCQLKYYETGGHGFNGLGDEPKAEMVKYFRQVL